MMNYSISNWVGDYYQATPTFVSPWTLPWYPGPYDQPFFPTVPATYPAPSVKPHKCPVCDGKGTVSAGFYENTLGEQECRSCQGKGVLWG